MNIMVGFDGSQTSVAAMKLAVEHARVMGAGLEIVQVIEQREDLSLKEIESVEGQLNEQVEDLLKSFDGVYQVHLLVADVTAGERLVEFADQNDIKEIVIGVRRRSKVGKLLFGLTAQYVILTAPCAVVSVK